jgi:hypothetical protein
MCCNKCKEYRKQIQKLSFIEAHWRKDAQKAMLRYSSSLQSNSMIQNEKLEILDILLKYYFRFKGKKGMEQLNDETKKTLNKYFVIKDL